MPGACDGCVWDGVCTPTQPACGVCPVRSICVANREGLQSEIPPKPLAKTVIEVREIAVVIHDATGCVLVCQRPADAIRWANMWEVPHAETRNDETDEVAVVRITEELTGFTVSPGQELLTVRHGVTRSAITMHCLAATRTQGRFRPGHYTESRWLQPSETQALPMSSPQRKLFEELTRTGRQLRLC